MERRIRVRIISLVVLIALVFSLFSFRIYKLQTAMTEAEIELQDSLTYQTNVSAARGQILDRNEFHLKSSDRSMIRGIIQMPAKQT